MREFEQKKAFIAEFNKALQTISTSIEKVELEEINYKPEKSDRVFTDEYLVVTYKGGAIAVRNCSCNSNLANIEAFTKLMYGGYYDEVAEYRQLKEMEIK